MHHTKKPPHLYTPADKHRMADWLAIIVVMSVVMVLTFACLDIGSR